jgi:type III secretory pathway component EscS
MYKFLSKHGQTVAFVIGVGVSVLFMLFIFIDLGGKELTSETFKTDGVPMEGAQLMETLEGIKAFDFGFYATYALLILSIVAAVVLSLLYFLTNFQLSALKDLVPMLVLVVVFMVVYNSYDPDTDAYLVKVARDTFSVGDVESRIVSGGITTSIFALFAAFASFIVAEIVNVFR